MTKNLCLCGCATAIPEGRSYVQGHNRRRDPVEAFLSRVEKRPGVGCWLWSGRVGHNGYGRATVNRKPIQAHRYSYELHVGPIPDGLQLDHLCRVRNCVRPDHLEPVTAQVNVLRGSSRSAMNARKTHCIRGHELAGDNLAAREGRRRCRTCHNDRQRDRRAAARSQSEVAA